MSISENKKLIFQYLVISTFNLILGSTTILTKCLHNWKFQNFILWVLSIAGILSPYYHPYLHLFFFRILLFLNFCIYYLIPFLVNIHFLKYLYYLTHLNIYMLYKLYLFVSCLNLFVIQRFIWLRCPCIIDLSFFHESYLN